jgi:hypothetical protein
VGWARRTKVKIGLAVVVGATITASIVAALTFSSPPPKIPLLNLPVPKFSLEGLAPGRAGASSAELQSGGATVVNFWGSWVRFVGIDEQDTRPAALRFLHRVGVTYQSGFDGSGAVGIDFRINGTPTTYFIAHGKMLDFAQGEVTKTQLLTYIRQIFGVSPQG